MDSETKETRWMFRFEPRKIQITIYTSLLSFIVFLSRGYLGVIDLWSSAYKIHNGSWYEIWCINEPSDSDCYALF